MEVRKVLTPLRKKDLKCLCRRRGLKVSGTKREVRKRLTYSYHGDLAALVPDLRRKDLLTIVSNLPDKIDRPAGLRNLRTSKLHEVCLAVFEGRYVTPNGLIGAAAKGGTENGRQSGSPDERAFDIVLHATSDRCGRQVAHVDENMLANMAADANSVTILSAYYVKDVLNAIARECRGEVRIVLNGLGGKRLKKQREELKSLQEQLWKQSRPTEIRLMFAKGLFHTKLYMFDMGSASVAWIGSANATKAGLKGRNEEVLVQVTPVPGSVQAYVESAWRRAIPVLECLGAVKSLTAFFRTGTLYYKTYVTLPMTINPFRRFINSLPEKERRRIAAFRSEFAETETGIGSFSLKLMFERQKAQLLEGESRGKRRRANVRRYAVETCYGYWVADPFVETVNGKLWEAAEQERHRLEIMHGWLTNCRNNIVNAYASYLKDVRGTLEEQRVEWRKYAKPNLFVDTSAVERRIDSLKATLGTDRQKRRCQAFVSSEVPEIWEDDAACAWFSGTFFDSLAFSYSSSRREGSAKRILDSLEGFLKEESLLTDPATEIRRGLEEALGKEDEDWYKDNFM